MCETSERCLNKNKSRRSEKPSGAQEIFEKVRFHHSIDLQPQNPI